MKDVLEAFFEGCIVGNRLLAAAMLRELTVALRRQLRGKPMPLVALDERLAAIFAVLAEGVTRSEDLANLALVVRVHITTWARQVEEAATPIVLIEPTSPAQLIA